MRPAAILFAAALAMLPAAAPVAAQAPSPYPAPVIEPFGPDSAVLGNPDAPVEIIVYVSLVCPHCATFHFGLFPHMRRTWIDKDLAYLIVRPMPTDPENLALASFQIARCAGHERYFEVVGDLYATQAALFSAAADSNAISYYRGIAQENGIDPATVEACIADPEGLARIDESRATAAALGINATPGFSINGKAYLSADFPSFAAFDAAVQEAIAARAALQE